MPEDYVKKGGFAFLELLAIIAILVVLASVLAPVFIKQREKRCQASCLGNQRELAVAVRLYAQEHEGVYPAVDEVWKEINAPSLLRCPTVGKANANDYVYNAFIAGKSSGQINYADQEIVTADGVDHLLSVNGVIAGNILSSERDIEFRHDAGNAFIASFGDGHVQLMREIPPVGIIDITDQSEFDREVMRCSYPTLVYFYTETASSLTPEYRYCRIINSFFIKTIAVDYHPMIKVVMVNGDKLPVLLTLFNVAPGTENGGYPVFLFLRNGKEEDRMAGYPTDCSYWDDTDWQMELSVCRQQVQQKLDLMLK